MPSDKDSKRRFNMSFNEARLPSAKATTIRSTTSGRTEEMSASRSLSPISIRNAMSPMISPVINGLRRLSRPSENPSTPSSKKERNRVKGEKMEGSFDEGSSSFGGASHPINTATNAATGPFNGSGTVSADTAKRNDKDKHESFASLGSVSLDAFELFDYHQSQRSDIPFQRPDMRTLLAPSGRDLDANNEESETMVETKRRSMSEKKSKPLSSKPPKPASFSTARDKHLTEAYEEQKPASFNSNKPPSGRAARSSVKKAAPTKPTRHLSTPSERSTKATVPTDPPNRKSDDRPDEGDGRGATRHSRRMSEGGVRLSSASPKPRMSEAAGTTSQVLPSPKPHKPTHSSGGTPGTPHKPRMSEATATTSQVLPSPKLHKPTHTSEVSPGGASPPSPNRRKHRGSEGSSRQAPASPNRLKHRSSDPSPGRQISVSPSRQTPRLSEGTGRPTSASPKRHRHHTPQGDSVVNGRQTSVASSKQQHSAKVLGEDELLSYLGLSSLPPPGHGRDQGRTNSTSNPNRAERERSASREPSASKRRLRGVDHKSTGRSGENSDPIDKSPSGQLEDLGTKHHSRDRSKKTSRRSSSRSKEEREHANTSPRIRRSKSDKQEYSSHRRRASHPTGEGHHQSRSHLEDNSKPRSDRLIAEENENRKSYRRGKRSSQHPRVATVTITADNARKEEDETEKPVSGRSIGLDDPTEKSSSDFQSAAERGNLAKEALANVRDIKEDLKQMRARRKTFSDSPLKAKADSAVQLPNVKFPLSIRSPAVTRTRHVPSPMIANGPMHQSLSALNSSRMTLNSSSISDLKYSVGAISLEDLDVGFFNKSLPVLPPIVTAEDVRIEELKKELKETMKLIKHTTHEVRKERDEITDYQRKNWSIRKSLMQNQGPSDSATSLNLKIERLLRQQRELDMETDQLRDQKDAIGETCSEITQRIEDTKALFDILTQVVVPLLPSADMPRGKDVSASSKMTISSSGSPSRKTVPSVSSMENEDDSIISVEVGPTGSFDTVKES